MLSHQLRNSLAPVRNSLYTLERAAPGGEQSRRAHTVIDRQVGQLARLRNLNELLRRGIEDHRTLFDKADVGLEAKAAPEPAHVEVDGNRSEAGCHGGAHGTKLLAFGGAPPYPSTMRHPGRLLAFVLLGLGSLPTSCGGDSFAEGPGSAGTGGSSEGGLGGTGGSHAEGGLGASGGSPSGGGSGGTAAGGHEAGADATAGDAAPECTGNTCSSGGPCIIDRCWSGWVDTSSFAEARDASAVFAHKGWLYSIGGSAPNTTQQPTSTIQAARILPDGKLETWKLLSPFLMPISTAAAAVYNDRVYVTGGWHDTLGNASDKVYYAELNPADGSIGGWLTAPSFAGARLDHMSLAVNGYLYVLGGVDGCSGFNDVQFAPIQADGSLGNWVPAQSFVGARHAQVAALLDDRIYLLGGINGCGQYWDDIQVAGLEDDGALSGWTSLGLTPNKGAYSAIAARNGYIYMAGGDGGGFQLSRADVAPVGESGAIGTWASAPPLPTGMTGMSATYGDYLYLLNSAGVRLTKLP